MKILRHKRILQILSENNIETQEELLKILVSEGFNVTQATVSRDIRTLKITKIQDEDGKYRYKLPEDRDEDMRANFDTFFRTTVTSVECAENIMVIKTLSGTAQAVCASFDSVNYSRVIGTIAGDDTIFAVCRDSDYAERLTAKLKRFIKIQE